MKVNDVEMINLKSFQDVSIFYTPTKEKSLTQKKSSLLNYRLNEELILSLNLFIKRTTDIFGSIIGLIMLLPITLLIFIANFFIGDKGSIFYSQERIGKNGKHFKIYKFRTMYIDADKRLEHLLNKDELAYEEYKKYKKLKNDPRVTKIGKFLRKTSIDEFPQFINILKGEMSLVGPRPYLPDEKSDIKQVFYNNIVKIRPGLTGPWQCSGRSTTTFEERVVMEATYVDDFSIFLDIKLLFKTIITVIKKEGAV